MCMVVGVDVIVKFLMLVILFVTKFTIKVSFKVFQSLGYRILLFSIILWRNNGENKCYFDTAK